jgi:hypothetical protein
MTLVADPPNGPEAAPPQFDAEGAGVVSSWADLAAALTAERVDPAQVGFTAAGAGLDTLGVLLHPFDGLLQAGLGWVIEHVGFLREPLDALAGDPDEVLAEARRWDLVAVELRAVAGDFRAATVPGWEGAAATNHRRAVDDLAAALSAGADQAAALSRLVLATGAAVGTVRALIRDTIVDFVSAVVQYLLAAGTLAFLTAGGSLASVVLTVVVRALEVAEDIARRVRQLLDVLVAAGDAAGRIGTALQRTAERVRRVEPALRATGDSLYRSADATGAPLFIEAGKQLTDASQARNSWPGHRQPATGSISK